MRISPEEFQRLELEVHAFLRGVPIEDVWVVDLPDGGPERTILDLRAVLSADALLSASALVRALVAIRGFAGRLFGWDRARPEHAAESYVHRLSPEQRSRSLVPPGTADGPFRSVYVYPAEALSEVRNATVHAFSCMALRPRGSGYRLYWAVYVKPVSPLTRLYMAAIDPFRRVIVYPTILRRARAEWSRAYGTPVGAG